MTDGGGGEGGLSTDFTIVNIGGNKAQNIIIKPLLSVRYAHDFFIAFFGANKFKIVLFLCCNIC